jgi:hypothetical protein
LNYEYKEDVVNVGFEYYDPINACDYVGYWNKEIYRLGIVYILEHNKLTPVFNIHGGFSIGELDLSTFTTASEYNY